jgi:dolichol kinase|tara:strand:- start:5148 stop:5738 length:591 start_codon:yes stop_codon:yes gene_type:complete
MKLNLEVKRKIAHILLGVLIVLMLSFGIINKIHIFFLAIIIIIISFLNKKHKIPIVYRLMHTLERDENVGKFPGKGLIFYFIGVFLVLSFFPLDIAVPAILILAFADSVGHLFGIRYGKRKHPYVSTKFVEGWIAGFIAGFIAAFVFVPWPEALAASFFAMLVEGIEIKIGAEEIDDNLIIPWVAASAIWAVRFFF